ncbi:hypothetical protein C4K39_4918 [Pseudomonas sessilinigenes]|uniref:Lipoprotein n=2 Tax=Pseudomonas TaxID=286 RepID=A0ABX8MYY9_9PSED|nr:hypothetical protein C4K39_4918 [Pseudomonas sessilinigenes]QXH43845.1 hypothetical protein KSS89_24920 [Pseudomonas sessilinigenes]UMZ15269.1 hypothetical protein I9018_15530 [Pseudomonas sp. MPFS]
MSSIFTGRVSGAMAFALILSGCSLSGTYPDATEADAAKLRFISDMSSATLGVFDEQNCDGQTTGILNNLFLADSRRRANMSIPPASQKTPYLEIRLAPNKERMLHLNTQGTGSVCGMAFTFTPQSGAEYELTFSRAGSQCVTSLKRLHQAQGQVVRSPVPLVNKGLASCLGANALFPAPVKGLPATVERDEMIEQIVSQSIISEMKPGPALSESSQNEAVDLVVDKRKRQMNLDLPDAYWTQFRQNVATYLKQAQGVKASALEHYKVEYHTRLSRLDTPAIKALVPDTQATDVTQALATNNAMLQYYHRLDEQLQKETMADHWTRMADLDKRYGVCERYAQCWQN